MPKLYFSPGACSLSPHIALRESRISFQLEQVDLKAKKTKTGADFLAINPKGYVPALAIDDGQILTEGAIIVQYIADSSPESQLAPAQGSFERVRHNEWLHFIATELHKGFGPINHPKSTEELKAPLKERLASRFAVLARGIGDKSFLLGDTFTVADGYAYYTLRSWKKLVGPSLGDSSVLRAYFERIGSRPAVLAALEAEGLTE